VAGGRAGEAEIADQLAADPTATGERAAATARAARPTPEAKAEAWASLLSPFVAPYFASLETVWASRTNEIAQTIAYGLYPLELAGRPDIDVAGLTQRWLAEHPGAAPALRRIVAELGDDTRRALAAQEADRRR